MVRKDAGDLKRERLRWISKEIAKRLTKGGFVDLRGLLNIIEYELGLTRKTGLSYVNLLLDIMPWKLEKVKGRNRIINEPEATEG